MTLSHDDSFMSLLSSSEEANSEDSFHSIPSLADNLDSKFSNVPQNFNITHINAQSIPAHYPDLLSAFQSKNIHSVLVSESWLKPCLPSISYSIPGFHLIRNDRVDRTGGGVAIYLRSHIPFSVISSSNSQTGGKAEYIFVEVVLSHTKLLLGVFYSPSITVNYFVEFELILQQLTPSYSHTIIMGDFNTCLIKNDHRSSRLKSLINGANLHILPSLATHFSPNCSPSLLDLSIVSSIDYSEKHGQCSAYEFSYHNLIYLSYKIKPPKAKSRILLQRNFGGMDLARLQEDASKIDWSNVLNTSCVDDQVDLLNASLTALYDTHAPIRPVRVKHLPAPWLTPEIKKIQEKKHKAKGKYVHDSSDSNWEKYVVIRNRCNKLCRDKQRRHIYKSVIEEKDSGRVWHFLQSLGVGKTRQDVNVGNLDLNCMNKHFSNSVAIDNAIKVKTINHISTCQTPDIPLFFLSQFSESDVKKNILAIKSDAVGSDCISRKMITPLLPILIPVLTSIFNNSINTNSFPSLWKGAQIIPLPKKRNASAFSDYRPISILPFLSKVLERLVHQQLSSFLTKYNLLNPFQSGFRPGHSTTTTLVKITDDIRESMDNKQVTVLTLLDFSNAFNSVDFDILLAILSSLNISPAATDWFHSYLYGRRQRVSARNSCSKWLQVNAGVPQGGVLSPLLFSLFINTINLSLSSLYHLYADDLQIYTHSSVSELPLAISRINTDLQIIHRWCNYHGLHINPSKTQAIIIGSSKLLTKIDFLQLPGLVFNNIIIPYSNSVISLGVTLDRYLRWGPHVTEVSRRVFASAASLSRLRNFLPISTKTILAQSLLLPILDYADICYVDISEELLNKLESLQNFCIRFIFGLRKYDHVSHFRAKLKWLPIRLRRNARILNTLYSILFNPTTPSYLKERFIFLGASHERSLRSEDNLTLKIPPHSSSFYSNSFTVQAARLWNSLPYSIKCAKSQASFKTKVKEHYLNSLTST